MAARIKVSYQEQQELRAVEELLKPVVRSCKVIERCGNGRFKRDENGELPISGIM